LVYVRFAIVILWLSVVNFGAAGPAPKASLAPLAFLVLSAVASGYLLVKWSRGRAIFASSVFVLGIALCALDLRLTFVAISPLALGVFLSPAERPLDMVRGVGWVMIVAHFIAWNNTAVTLLTEANRKLSVLASQALRCQEIPAGPSATATWTWLLCTVFLLAYCKSVKQVAYTSLLMILLLLAQVTALVFLVCRDYLNVYQVFDYFAPAVSVLYSIIGSLLIGKDWGKAATPPTTHQGSPNSRLRACMLVTVACVLVGLSCQFAIAPPSPKVVQVYEKDSYLDWDKPDHRLGRIYAGFIGMLPKYSELAGINVVPYGGTELTLEELRKGQVLLLMNPFCDWSENDLAVAQEYVSEGGSLLVLADHTDIMGTQKSINRICEFAGISVKFDSAFPLNDHWLEGFEVRSRYALPGLVRASEFGLSVGASLELKKNAYVVAEGKYAFSDIGDRNNEKGAFLGGYRFDKSEELGDLVLIGASDVGKGRVVVFGDTSPFQNLGLPSTFFSTCYPILSFLVSPNSIGEWLRFATTALAFIVGLVSLSVPSLNGWRFLVVAVPLVIGIQERALNFRLVRQAQQVGDYSELAIIDRIDLNNVNFSMSSDKTNVSLLSCLMRGNYTPVLVNSQLKGIKESSLLHVLIDPSRHMDKQQLENVVSYMDRGGSVVVFAGPDSTGSLGELFARFKIKILPIPLGPYPVAREDSYQGPQFVEAWPVACDHDSFTVLAKGYEYDLAVSIDHGRGRLVIVGDPRFFEGDNVESLQGGRQESLDFVLGLFEHGK